MKDIQFRKGSPNCAWLGRNGTFFNASGVSLTRTQNGTVMIEPLTSRGHIGRCLIEFPISAIPEITAFLERQERE